MAHRCLTALWIFVPMSLLNTGTVKNIKPARKIDAVDPPEADWRRGQSPKASPTHFLHLQHTFFTKLFVRAAVFERKHPHTLSNGFRDDNLIKTAGYRYVHPTCRAIGKNNVQLFF
jgi:hypothetical protein